MKYNLIFQKYIVNTGKLNYLTLNKIFTLDVIRIKMKVNLKCIYIIYL